MQRIFFSNLVLTLFLNLLIKPLALFGIDATVQNRVGPEEYGLYFSLLNLSVIFNMLIDLGINNYTTKNIAQEPEIAKKYFGKLISFRLLLFLAYLVVVFTFGAIVGYNAEQFSILLILSFNQLFILITAFCRSHFSGFHFFKYDALISVLDRTLLILFGGSLLFLPGLGIKITVELFVGIHLICYALTTVVALALLLKHVDRPYFQWDLKFSLGYVKQSLPYALLVVLMLLYTRVDGVMLERIHPKGAYESGIYAQGFRLLDALFMFGMIFTSLLFPMFSKQLKEDRKAMHDLLFNAGNLLTAGSLVIVIVVISNASFLLNLIYTNGDASVPSFQLLMGSFLAIAVNFIFGTLLTANGNMKFLNWTSVVGIFVNAGLNLWLIPKYGATGAALTTLVTQSIVSLSQFIYCQKLFQIGFNLNLIVRYFLLVFPLIGLVYFLPNIEGLFFIQMVLGGILLIALSFIRVDSLKMLLSKSEK